MGTGTPMVLVQVQRVALLSLACPRQQRKVPLLTDSHVGPGPALGCSSKAWGNPEAWV